MNLYQIQSDGEALFVVATSYQNAIDKWKAHIAREIERPVEQMFEPESVTFLADENDLIR